MNGAVNRNYSYRDSNQHATTMVGEDQLSFIIYLQQTSEMSFSNVDAFCLVVADINMKQGDL